MIAGVFKVFFSTDAQNQRAKRRRKLLEQEHSAQRERDYAQLVVDRQAELQFERERLKGTGKVPFVDWEESFLATHIIRFRRPSPPRSRPIGWNTDWDKDQLLRQEGCCFWCGSPLNGVAHRDHVEPLARGGANNVSNLVMACPPCNLDKSASEPQRWLNSTSRVSAERKAVLLTIISTSELSDISELNSMPEIPETHDEPIEFEIIQSSLFDDLA